MPLSVIESLDNTGLVIVDRIPRDGSGEFKLGSQLIVQESQTAFFYRDGRLLDQFSAGRHTLTTLNLPLVGALIGAPFGGQSPFRAYVYFVKRSTVVGLGWGTASPIMFRDSELRMVSLRGFGSYSLRVDSPAALLQNLVGTKGLVDSNSIAAFCRSMIVSRMNETIGARLKTLIDLSTSYQAIALACKQSLQSDFSQYGLELVDLVIEAITVPQEVQDALNRATGVAAQDIPSYQAVSAADAMRDVARNPGPGGAGFGAGYGAGLGMEMARQMASASNAPRDSASPHTTRDITSTTGATDQRNIGTIRETLVKLKSMKDEGLISEEDYKEQKRRLLSTV